LAVFPVQSSFSLPLISQISGGISISLAYEVVEELINTQFLEPAEEEDSYKFVHDITRRQVMMTTPHAVIKESAISLINAIRTIDRTPTGLEQLYTLATLEFRAENFPIFVSSALGTATRLLAAGSYSPALELFRECLALPAQQLDLSSEIEARLGMAEVLYGTGYYDEGLEVIGMADLWPSASRARGLLVRGRLLLRLTRFPESLAALEVARQQYQMLDQAEGILQCDKEEITILRDLGEYDAAINKSYRLMAKAREATASASVLGSCFRAAARSLAFTGRLDDALFYARQAYDLAMGSGSALEVGNARLAIGECYRLSESPTEAVAHYETAANTALALGNRDSYLWSLLGLADCYLMKGDASSAKASLRPVTEIVSLSSTRYPLIYLHWRLSELSIRSLLGVDTYQELQSTVAQYASLDIYWPRQYVERLVNGDHHLPPKQFG
jgi:tetratricopeptide (TPR) repeat protein